MNAATAFAWAIALEPAARAAYDAHGRGAWLVDLREQPVGGKLLATYHPAIQLTGELAEKVARYVPAGQIVLVFLGWEGMPAGMVQSAVCTFPPPALAA